MNSYLETLLRAAAAAPSGDNTQPWRFGIAPDGSAIEIEVDPARDASLMNANQRMARIAVGAATENLLRTAAHNRWNAELTRFQNVDSLAIKLAIPQWSEGEIDEALLCRVTNRRYYDGSLLPTGTLLTLQQKSACIHGVRTHWIADRRKLRALANLIGRSDGILFGHQLLRRAILENVRFDLPPDAIAEEGLPVGSLALPLADRIAFRGLKSVPEWLFAAWRINRIFAAKAVELVKSASAICIVARNKSGREADFQVGRVMQQAWISATQHGLAVQPMMSACVLQNVVENAEDRLSIDSRSKIRQCREEIAEVVPQLQNSAPAAILRVGFAAAPPARTGRLPLGRLLKPSQESRTLRFQAMCWHS